MTFSKIIVRPSSGTYIGDFMEELYKLSIKYKCDVIAKFDESSLFQPRFN